MIDKNGIRQLCYVARVTAIEPIEGADRVEVARVGGWTCMVPKGAFQPGSLGIFFEVDSKVPATEPFAFMEKRKYHVKVQKFFKGTVISDALFMAPADFGWESRKDENGEDYLYVDGINASYREGDFLTDALGVTYYEVEDQRRKSNGPDKYARMAARHPKIFKNPIVRKLYKTNFGKKLLFFFFGRKVKKTEWPAWVVKTDEERVQNLTRALEAYSSMRWIATEKIDGTSTTFTMRRPKGMFAKPEMLVCSRNVVFDKPDKKCFYETNVYTEMAEKYNMENVLLRLLESNPDAEWVTIQGETYGEGVQKRDYSMKGHDFMAFNLIFSNTGRKNSIAMRNILEGNFGIPCVPIVAEDMEIPNDVDAILDMAGGPSKVDGLPREGIVFRSTDGVYSFKAVDKNFILKYHG